MEMGCEPSVAVGAAGRGGAVCGVGVRGVRMRRGLIAAKLVVIALVAVCCLVMIGALAVLL